MKLRTIICAALALLAVPASAQLSTATPAQIKFQQSDTPDTRLRKLEIVRKAVVAGGGGGVTSFNTRTGAVSLTSSDVTTALTFTPLRPSNNLSDVSSASTARTNLGLGTAATFSSSSFLQSANNLSDLASASTARTNLGLGAFATSTDAANLTGTISVSRFNSGTGASSSTFLRGDGTWATPAGGGTTTNAITWNNGGAGAASGTTFNGSAAVTVSYNTVGAAPLASPTFTGKVTTAASGTGGAGLNLPHGAAPTSPVNGDVWTTTSGTFWRINGVTQQAAFGGGTATGTNTGDQTITLTGDVTGSGTGSFATAIGANKVTRSMLAATSGVALLGATAAGNVSDLSATSATSILNAMVGANGTTGGTKGLVPAPAATDNVNFLRGDGTWAAPAGGGGTTTNALTLSNNGLGAASGTTFNGSAAVTLSWNTIGAQQSDADLTAIAGLTGAGIPWRSSTGTWSQNLVGYPGTQGMGGSVTQATSRTTGVTLNTASGAITLFSTTTTAGLVTSFTVTDSQVNATDTVILSQKSGTGIYFLGVTAVAAGSFKISVYTPAAVGSAEAPVINFAVVKAATT